MSLNAEQIQTRLSENNFDCDGVGMAELVLGFR
jgi:hypothetical protein